MTDLHQPIAMTDEPPARPASKLNFLRRRVRELEREVRDWEECVRDLERWIACGTPEQERQ